MYVVHWVPNDAHEMIAVQFSSRDEENGYRAGLLAGGVALVSEVAMSA